MTYQLLPECELLQSWVVVAPVDLAWADQTPKNLLIPNLAQLCSVTDHVVPPPQPALPYLGHSGASCTDPDPDFPPPPGGGACVCSQWPLWGAAAWPWWHSGERCHLHLHG
jgi:hypothetical protein